MASIAGLFSFGTLVTILKFIIASLPLLFVVRFLGGRASIVKILFANILVAVLGVLILSYFDIAGGLWLYVIPFGVLLVVYSILFEISIIKAFIAWILQLFVFFLLKHFLPL